MNTQRLKLFALSSFAALAVLTTACAPATPLPTQAPPQPTAAPVMEVQPTEAQPTVAPTAATGNNAEAEAPVRRFAELVNAGDKAGALALFSPTACVAYGSGSCKSAEDLARWWDSDIFSVEGKIQDFELTTNGNKVTLLGQFNSNGWSGRANYLFTVENGSITGWSLR